MSDYTKRRSLAIREEPGKPQPYRPLQAEQEISESFTRQLSIKDDQPDRNDRSPSYKREEPPSTAAVQQMAKGSARHRETQDNTERLRQRDIRRARGGCRRCGRGCSRRIEQRRNKTTKKKGSRREMRMNFLENEFQGAKAKRETFERSIKLPVVGLRYKQYTCDQTFKCGRKVSDTLVVLFGCYKSEWFTAWFDSHVLFFF